MISAHRYSARDPRGRDQARKLAAERGMGMQRSEQDISGRIIVLLLLALREGRNEGLTLAKDVITDCDVTDADRTDCVERRCCRAFP